MPKLHFGDSYSNIECGILSKTFRDNCRQLGIIDSDATVLMRRKRLGPVNHQGMMAQVEEGLFVMYLNSNGFTTFEAISVIGHETVHMWQHLRGDMIDDPEGDGTSWKGEHYPKKRINDNYHTLPWEVEAFERQPILLQSALKRLTAIEAMYVIMSSEDIINQKMKNTEGFTPLEASAYLNSINQ